MKMLVSGEGKEDFIKGLKKIVEVMNSKECIVVDIDDNAIMDSSKFISLLNTMDKPVTYGILK